MMFRTLMHQTGQVIGMAFSSAVQQTTLEASLAHALREEDAAVDVRTFSSQAWVYSTSHTIRQLVASVRQNATSIVDLPANLKEACIAAYSTSLHVVFLTSAALLLAAGILAALVRTRACSQ
jgi:hypothetical protein